MKVQNMAFDENTFIVSDTHFGHQKILEKEPHRFDDLSSKKEVFKRLRKRWNNLIQDNDTLLHLGDLIGDKGKKYIKKLKGHKYLILGNHDIKEQNFSVIQQSDFCIIHGLCLLVPQKQEILEQMQFFLNNLPIEQQSLLSAVVADICGIRILFSHYPLFDRYPNDNRFIAIKEILEKLFEISQCAMNIHGHTHSHDTFDNRCVNACIDKTDFMPIRLKDLLSKEGF
ncbi:metallophosphoesterase [Helicobacter monodelphidis]|uniref:metallophosphoesterase n=1 Tax=Helicobacter sp. 15-1451 TaxID=2004995 RepID=UPI0015EC8712|nr:metallophosphoesterase [Helicobacter sp. 15-1451]